MKLDPVIKEVYRAKEEFAREIGNDVGKLFERLREDEKKHPERMNRTIAEVATHPTPQAAARKTVK